MYSGNKWLLSSKLRSFETSVNCFSIANKNVLPIEQIILVLKLILRWVKVWEHPYLYKGRLHRGRGRVESNVDKIGQGREGLISCGRLHS